MKRLVRSLTVTACAAALVGLGVAPAVAAPLPPDQRAAGLWHVDVWDLDALQKSGATGDGVKIAVIDDFINPDVPELQGTNVIVRGTTCLDPATDEPKEIVSDDPAHAAHGTNVVSMLIGNGAAADGGQGARGIAPDAEVWFYGLGDIDQMEKCDLQDPTRSNSDVDLSTDISLGSGTDIYVNPAGLGDASALAARAALRDGADIISVSVLSGLGDWDQVLVEAQAKGVPIVSATPNPDTESGFLGGPWMTNGAIPISAIDNAGKQLTSLSTGDEGSGSLNLAFAAPGASLLGVGNTSSWGPEIIDGTSFATPLVAGSIALGMDKYPKASAFQVLQSMVRTTGASGEHDPTWSGTRLGYGYANPSSALELDPTKFPDKNPLFVDDISDPRCVTSDGVPGSVAENGAKWLCAWSVGPYPPQIEAYDAVVHEGAQVLASGGERVDSPYSAPHASSTSTGNAPSWVVAGGIGLLVIVGVVTILIVARNRRRRVNPSPLPPQDRHPEHH